MAKNKCREFVLFGVAFEQRLVELLFRSTQRQQYLEAHGKCFFMFVLEEHLQDYQGTNNSGADPVFWGHTWLIPIDRSMLPYREVIQNVPLFKYSGSFLFQNVQTIVWQDAAFLNPTRLSRQPEDYSGFLSHRVPSKDSCMVTFALPETKETIGKNNLALDEDMYQEHCKAIAISDAVRHDLGLTSMDTSSNTSKATTVSSSVLEQCHDYIQNVYRNEMTNAYLSHGISDLDFIVWNESSDRCKLFNQELRCKMLEELTCHGNNWDQVVFPYVLYKLRLRTEYRRKPAIPIDGNFKRRGHDVRFVKSLQGNDDDNEASKPNKSETVVTVVHTTCHWEKKRLGVGCASFPTSSLAAQAHAAKIILETERQKQLLSAEKGLQ